MLSSEGTASFLQRDWNASCQEKFVLEIRRCMHMILPGSRLKTNLPCFEQIWIESLKPSANWDIMRDEDRGMKGE
jgi:hypothetical protein